MNAIELTCRVPGTFVEAATVSSHNGWWGDWTAYNVCPQDYWLVAFTLRVEAYVGGGMNNTTVPF